MKEQEKIKLIDDYHELRWRNKHNLIKIYSKEPLEHDMDYRRSEERRMLGIIKKHNLFKELQQGIIKRQRTPKNQ